MLSCFFREQGNGEREPRENRGREREPRENWVCRRGNRMRGNPGEFEKPNEGNDRGMRGNQMTVE
jgi:hypothetical protein